MLTWNQIGDWNPQLIREIRGRLTPNHAWVVLGGSLVAQILLVVIFRSLLPDDSLIGEGTISNRYCLGELTYPESSQVLCGWDTSGYLSLNMPLWWRDLFRLLTFLMPLIWIPGSTYGLIGDLVKEKNQGTLNFIQLSPRSGTSILLGKLLGVPLLLHLLLVTILPLYLVSAGFAQIPGVDLFSFSIAMIGIWGLVGSGALLFALLGGTQAWMGCISVGLVIYPLSWMNAYGLFGEDGKAAAIQSTVGQLRWFEFPIGSSGWMAASFIVISSLVGLGWIWWVMTRWFRSPEATVLSKPSSYVLTLCLHLSGLGFVWRFFSPELWMLETFDATLITYPDVKSSVVIFWILQVPLWIMLITCLAPQRQAVLDWVYYRRDQASSKPFTLIRDLIWGEKSPGILALAINLAIVVMIWLPVVWLMPMAASYRVGVTLGLLAAVPLWLIYGVVAQGLLLPQGVGRWISSASLYILLGLPLVLALIWVEAMDRSLHFWAFFVYGFSSYAVGQISVMPALVGLCLPWLVLGLLLVMFSLQIRRMGRSQVQQALSQVRSF